MDAFHIGIGSKSWELRRGEDAPQRERGSSWLRKIALQSDLGEERDKNTRKEETIIASACTGVVSATRVMDVKNPIEERTQLQGVDQTR